MTDASALPRRLTRSTDDRMVAGVCGGIAAYTGLDPRAVRLATVVLTIFGAMGLCLYVVAWLLVPAADQDESWAEGVARRVRR